MNNLNENKEKMRTIVIKMKKSNDNLRNIIKFY